MNSFWIKALVKRILNSNQSGRYTILEQKIKEKLVKKGNKVPWNSKKEFIEYIHKNYSDLIHRKSNNKHLRKSSYN